MVWQSPYAASRASRLALQRMRWHVVRRGGAPVGAVPGSEGGGGRGGRRPAFLASLTRIVPPSSSVEKCERKRLST